MKENRVFLLRTLLVWLLLELVAAAQVPTPDGSRVLWQWLRTLSTPVAWSGRQLAILTTDFALGLRNTRRLLADNRHLRDELEEARARNLLLTEDRAALREATDMLRETTGMEASSLVGRCAFRNLAQGRMEVRVSAGAWVRRDTPVIGAGGLVGRVVHSTHRQSWLELVTHPAAAVAVQDASGLVRGLAVGTGGMELEVEYVPRSARLLRGDILVTSGADGIYPPGIAVARVTSIRESEVAFLEIRALPAVELATMRVVLLLPDWARDREVVDPP